MSITILEPSYYSQFFCLAADCKRTCCQHWTIGFTKKDYDRLRSKHLPAKMREKLRQCTRRIQSPQSPFYAEFQLDGDGKCSLLCDGLCQLQRECGAEYLPLVCQIYPRQHRRIGELLLRSCHNSCEAVHQLLLTQKSGLSLVRRPATAGEWQQVLNEKNMLERHPLETHYETVLITMLALMQNRAYPLGDRLLLVGMAAKELDTLIIEGRMHDITAWMMKYAALATGDALADRLAQHPKNLTLGVHNCIGSMLGLNWSAPQLWLGEVIERLGIEVKEIPNDPESLQMTLDLPRLERQTVHLATLLEEYPLYLESVLINQMIDTFFPFFIEKTVYSDFLALCSSYAAIRVGMIAYAGESGTLQDAVDGAVYTARILEHSKGRLVSLVDRFRESETDTLAHMAYLVHI